MRRRDALGAVGGALTLSQFSRSAAAQSDEFEPLGTLPLTGAKEAVVGEQGFVYVAVTDGYAVVDVSDPESPQVVHENRNVLADHEDGPLGGIYDVKVDGKKLAVTGPANFGPSLKAVVVYDVSDPRNPQQLSVHETEFFNHNCDISDGVVLLCGNNGTTNALVTVDAETGKELGRWSVVSQNKQWQEVSFIHWPLHDVSAHDGVAYLAQWDAGTWMVDVSDPANPELISQVRGREPSEFSDLSSDASYEEGRQAPGNDHYVAASDDGSLLAISIESWDIDPQEEDVKPGSVYLYDVSDPEQPRQLSEIPAPPSDDERFEGVWTTSHNFEIRGDRLFTSWYRGGVKVYDISDPAAPEELAHWRDSASTSFWTAQYATPKFFIASSRKDPSQMTESSQEQDGTGAALYTFPVPSPETPTASPTRSPSEPTSSPATGQPGFGLLTAAAAMAVGGARWMFDRTD